MNFGEWLGVISLLVALLGTRQQRGEIGSATKVASTKFKAEINKYAAARRNKLTAMIDCPSFFLADVLFKIGALGILFWTIFSVNGATVTSENGLALRAGFNAAAHMAVSLLVGIIFGTLLNVYSAVKERMRLATLAGLSPASAFGPRTQVAAPSSID
ncbi:hypothetical protein ELE36_17310 [Pseudolysobacter antarcticus]|uniref:Uncharacterized protein n=1 Tax=Pseudolysobacter antarcticus TaxID=2511995 RepID=A0A411HNC6_9GAMM|nr:hypothetical protein [Pseudolysobacter antarcticus]QBB71980.1 hypothetical protein ELE36_17310 [Pseudolysobacter antarcticus]